MRVIFAGTPEFAVNPLLELIKEHTVVAVFTQPDRKSGRGKRLTPPPVKEVAQQHDIAVFQPESFKSQEQLIESLDADVMVVVAYGMLLPKEVLEIPKFGCINIHASLLPRWRGAAPIQRCIEAGDSVTGVCIMKMEEGLDTGGVYTRLELPIGAKDTSATLHDKLSQLGATGISATLKDLSVNPNLEAVEQDHSLANYAHKIHKREAEIDWTLSAEKIDAKCRAFMPWPVCQTHHTGSDFQCRIRIWESTPAVGTDNAPPGTVLQASSEGLVVACAEGRLKILVLQKDGSKPLPVHEFLNGHSIKIGDVFGLPD